MDKKRTTLLIDRIIQNIANGFLEDDILPQT